MGIMQMRIFPKFVFSDAGFSTQIRTLFSIIQKPFGNLLFRPIFAPQF